MTMVKVLYQRTPMWRVGEDRPPSTSADLAARLEEFSALSAAERYPGDYSGRVISVLPADREFSPADLADPRRAVTLMDDDGGLRSKRLKIVRKGTADVTFDDRMGAVGPKLREKHADPEAWERDEIAAVEAAEAANLAAHELYDLELAAYRITRDEYVKALVAYDPLLSVEPPVVPEQPKPPTLVERENIFTREAAELAGSLPPTVTHTGAGLYKVQAAGTMATPAHLWAMDAVDPPDIGTPGGNPGTGSNVTVVGGQIGSALEFNGNNSYVDVGDVAELNAVAKLTMAFRMNPDALDATDYLFNKAVDGTHGFLALTAPGVLRVYLRNGADTYADFDYTLVMSAQKWHQLTIVFDGSQPTNATRLVVYVDGIPVTLAFTGTIPATTADMIGQDMTFGRATTSFDGKLDDARIYADALTDAQVKDIAGRGLGHWDTIAASVKDNGTSTITLTTGTAEDRTGEVFVAGGNAYAVSAKIDDTHITVIGDASAEAGACSISPYTTIQSALDQLWADQGATTFTATQYVRVFAGTYDENVEPNAGLSPSFGDFALIIEGDPTDDRDNIILAPTAGTPFQVGGPDYVTLRHMKVAPVGTETYGIYFKAGSQKPTVSDLHVVDWMLNPIYMYYAGIVEDSVIQTSRPNVGLEGLYLRLGGVVRNCSIIQAGASAYGSGIWSNGHVRIEACTIAGFTWAVITYDGRLVTQIVCRHLNVYDCTTALWSGSYIKDYELELINCIFSTVTTCIRLNGTWPDESAGLFGPRMRLRNNCFYSYTNFADDGVTTKTHAEFIALSRCDASGDLDATDPLLTSPATGDFSLQAASPCRGTGHGSGVVAYVDGIAADASHPNIGAEGTAADPPAPAWTAGLSSLAATDERVGDEIALTWGAASIGGAGLSIEYGVQRRIGAGAWTTVWIGSGTSTHVYECTTDQLYQFRVGARCADYEQAWVYPTDSATATATLPVPPTVSDWTVSGTTVTVTLTGLAGRTYRVRLMDGAGGEDDEQGRTGSGDVALTAAGYGARYFIAWEVVDGIQSEPTGVYAVTVDDPADADVAYYRVRTVMSLPGAPHKTAILERIERPIQP